MTLGNEATEAPALDSPDVVEHFTARAKQYDRSSHWCKDPEMMQAVMRIAAPRATDRMLDVACGTGLVSDTFRDKVGFIAGLDLTPAMAANAVTRLDCLTLGAAERMPFADGTFDLVVCRQGIQFMHAGAAVGEMVRVTKPGGRVVLIDLCAYGEDREECFAILRLRNPARRNFFVPDDVAKLLQKAGCAEVASHRYVSRENVDVWSGNGAISEWNREQIREIYQNASAEFRRLHAPEFLDDGKIIDHMLFAITAGVR